MLEEVKMYRRCGFGHRWHGFGRKLRYRDELKREKEIADLEK